MRRCVGQRPEAVRRTSHGSSASGLAEVSHRPLVIEGLDKPYGSSVAIWMSPGRAPRRSGGRLAPGSRWLGRVHAAQRHGAAAGGGAALAGPDPCRQRHHGRQGAGRSRRRGRCDHGPRSECELLEHRVATDAPVGIRRSELRRRGPGLVCRCQEAVAASLTLRRQAVGGADFQVLRVDMPAPESRERVRLHHRRRRTSGVVLVPSVADVDRTLEDVVTGAPDHGAQKLCTDAAVGACSGGEADADECDASDGAWWRVASPDAHPWLQLLAPDGMPRALVERDVGIVTACGLALNAFVAWQNAAFEPLMLGRGWREVGAPGGVRRSPGSAVLEGSPTLASEGVQESRTCPARSAS